MASKNKKLRSGYTTGACAAAAAKAATMILLNGESVNRLIGESQNNQSFPIHPFTCSPIYHDIEIPFPDGSRVKFKIQDSRIKIQDEHLTATASVIKDAGDDPDITNGAEISATVRIIKQRSGRAAEQQDKDKDASALTVKGGEGVGIVTKPGLPIPVGEAAINPVPRRMIKEAVMEAILEQQGSITAEHQDEKN
ncbi:MAG: cobalt-precorrin-5B (C(1))-methyltransferase, partial [Thermodesulfovibrionales bacterium]|nr:cobalt-precorrin-5B (C(1))-methyltransferase [Thermodesulfovibrionales bacterium]